MGKKLYKVTKDRECKGHNLGEVKYIKGDVKVLVEDAHIMRRW